MNNILHSSQQEVLLSQCKQTMLSQFRIPWLLHKWGENSCTNIWISPGREWIFGLSLKLLLILNLNINGKTWPILWLLHLCTWLCSVYLLDHLDHHESSKSSSSFSSQPTLVNIRKELISMESILRPFLANQGSSHHNNCGDISGRHLHWMLWQQSRGKVSQ